MINSIAEYLHQLRHELTGCDPATVIDALSDTEDHLNTAVASAKSPTATFRGRGVGRRHRSLWHAQ